MAKNEEKIRQFENSSRTIIFKKLYEARNQLANIINRISTNLSNLGLESENIPNAAIILIDKINDISNEFKKRNMSMYSFTDMKEGITTSSRLGDAVMEDLIDKFEEAVIKLKEYSKTIEDVANSRTNKMITTTQFNIIREIGLRLKELIIPTKSQDLAVTMEQQEELSKKLEEYISANEKIKKYNLQENIIPAIVKYMAGKRREDGTHTVRRHITSAVPFVLEASIEPELKGFLYDGFIGELKEALNEEYLKDAPNTENIDMCLYIPFPKREHN